MILRTLVVDDEAPARSELIYLLRDYETIAVIGEASSGTQAINMLEEYRPVHLVFLDISMPGEDGIAVATKLWQLSAQPMIVFCTAFQEHALQAFEVNAVDYLLKPVTPERLAKTMARVTKMTEGMAQSPTELISQIGSLVQALQQRTSSEVGVLKVPVKQGERVVLINPEEIIYVEAKGRHTMVCLQDDCHISPQTIQELEDRLNPLGFFRCHRSYLINMRQVRELVPWFNGAYQVVVADAKHTELPVSRQQVRELKWRMGLL